MNKPYAPNADADAVRAHIAGHEAELIATLVDWSQRNTGSFNRAGLDAFAPLLVERFSSLPGEAWMEAAPTYDRVRADGATEAVASAPLVRVSVRPEAPVQVVMTGHYDTVFPVDSAFQSVRELRPGVLNGPGLADMKGGILVMHAGLSAFEALAGEDARGVGYQILLSPDEEIGSPASAPTLLALGRKADLGMTYEPALPTGGLARARKASANFSVVIHGKSAHAGRDHASGRSAIAAAARFVAALEALNGRREGVTFNTGRIDGGGANNLVPELAVVRFNMRAPDQAGVDWALGEIDRLIAAAGAEDGISVHRHGGVSRGPKPCDARQEALFAFVRQSAKALGFDLDWQDTGGVCEGNNLYQAGCPNLDTLGVRGGRIHSDEEFIELDSLVERASLTALSLIRLSRGALDLDALRAARPKID